MGPSKAGMVAFLAFSFYHTWHLVFKITWGNIQAENTIYMVYTPLTTMVFKNLFNSGSSFLWLSVATKVHLSMCLVGGGKTWGEGPGELLKESLGKLSYMNASLFYFLHNIRTNAPCSYCVSKKTQYLSHHFSHQFTHRFSRSIAEVPAWGPEPWIKSRCVWKTSLQGVDLHANQVALWAVTR